MDLKIKSIANKGDAEKERLVIQVLNDTDVGDYVLFRTGWKDDAVTTRVYDTFWFPDKNVKAGDLVVIYSRRGAKSERVLESGSTAHFFYWARTDTLWGTPDRGAVLLHAPTWDSAPVSEL